jgi:hypothetical protein
VGLVPRGGSWAQSPTDSDKTPVRFNIQTGKGAAEGRSECGGRSRAQSLNIFQAGLGKHPEHKKMILVP